MPVFLFTDIEKSTQRWESQREAMSAALKRHDAILTARIEAAGGRIIKHTGDGVFAVFEGGDPSGCALDIQRDFNAEDWGDIGDLRIRIGLHAGDAEVRQGDYFGPAVGRAARIMGAAWGSQILLSTETRSSLTLPPGAAYVDLGLHQLKDLVEPVHLHMLGHPDLRADFPPPRSLSSRPNNLPPQTAPFVGRRRELENVASLLGAECRVVTMLGPGGIGKTRLGLQTAAEHVDAYKDGVYFVPLASLSSTEAIVPAMAEALKFQFSGSSEPQAQLVNYLQPKMMLLVLDNFEHLIDGAQVVSDIVSHAPEVQVIATSRTRLNLGAECVYNVDGMQFPDDEAQEVFEAFEAVEMFITYAQRANPDYVLTDDQRGAVVKICQLVGGMPLGIELAAAWARMLLPAEIAKELESDLDFLAANRADLPERQRSMRAVFDYSWKLLSENERDVLVKLSIFKGGFTRRAAQAVTGTSLVTLTALADQSLIQWQPGVERYQIHELLRQFAEERLEAAGFSDEARAAHSDYYLKTMAAKRVDLKGGDQPGAIADIRRDFENMRAGWNWALAQEAWHLLEEALESLFLFVLLQSRVRDADDVFGSVIRTLADKLEMDHRLLWARATYSLYAVNLSPVEDVEARYREMEEVLALIEQHGTPRDEGGCYEALMQLAHHANDWERAYDYMRKSLRAYEAAQDMFYIGRAHSRVGYTASVVDEEGLAIYVEEHERGLEISRTIGDMSGITMAAGNLAWSDVVNFGEFARAAERAMLAADHARELGYRTFYAHNTILLGLIALLDGELDAGREHLLLGESVARDIQFSLSIAYALGIRAALVSVEEDYESAMQLAEESLRNQTNPLGEAMGQWGMAMASAGQGEFERARAAIREVLPYHLRKANFSHALDVLPCAALLLNEDGRPVRAVEILSLSFNEPRAARKWKEKWTLLKRLQGDLQEALGADAYDAAWERGKTLELIPVTEELIKELGG